MKSLCAAVLLVALSAGAAAAPADPQSDTNKGTSPPVKTTDSNRTPKSDADTDETSTDDAWTTAPNGVDYETGQICLTRGAGGVCLDSSDDE